MAPTPPQTPQLSDPAYQEYVRRQQNKKGRQFKFLIPLIYAPVLPLIRLSLRHRPVLRDRLFTGVLAGAFVHGMYLVCLEAIFMILRANELVEARTRLFKLHGWLTRPAFQHIEIVPDSP